MSDLAAPALLRHGQACRHRGLGRHRGQWGEGVQVSPHVSCPLCVGDKVTFTLHLSGPGLVFSWCVWSGMWPSLPPSSSGEFYENYLSRISESEPLLPQLYKISGQQNLLSSLIILFHCLPSDQNHDWNNFFLFYSFSCINKILPCYPLIGCPLCLLIGSSRNVWWLSVTKDTGYSLNCPALNLIYNALKLIQTRQQVAQHSGAKNDLKLTIWQ